MPNHHNDLTRTLVKLADVLANADQVADAEHLRDTAVIIEAQPCQHNPGLAASGQNWSHCEYCGVPLKRVWVWVVDTDADPDAT